MKGSEIERYLEFLSNAYAGYGGEHIEVVVCGGAALNLMHLKERVTKDVDVLYPDPLPKEFRDAAVDTARYFGLNENWVDERPVDLYRMGLPEGFFERCKRIQYHPKVTYLITSRFDQIHFKLYAAVDRGDYHLVDLKDLNPELEELVRAAKWCCTHDVSEVFKEILLDFLEKQGWANAAEKFSQES